MTLPFQQPQNNFGGFFNANVRDPQSEGNLIGHLVLITRVVREGQNPANDQFRPNAPHLIVDMVDLGIPDQGYFKPDNMPTLREGVVVKYPGIQNRMSVGQTNVLGRVAIAYNKSNQALPTLDAFTEQDAAVAQYWLDNQPKANAFTAPTEQAPAPAPVQTAPAGPPAAPVAAPAPAPVPQAPGAPWQSQGAVQAPAAQAPVPTPGLPAHLANDPALKELLNRLPGTVQNG